jgi:NAD(P)H-dependent FMN reductase
VTVRLVGLSGSLRAGSFNTALLRAAQGLVPADVELVAGSIHGVPLYDGDLERDEGLPPAVVALKELIAGADGLMLFTPEYNNGIPGVFKNAIDWLSRPSSDIARIFGGRPVAVLGASPGGFGTILSQAAWLPVLHTLGADHWAGERLMVARAGSVFNEAGDLIDEATRRRLAALVAGFAEHCGKTRT